MTAVTTRHNTARTVVTAALVLLAASLAVRGWVLSRGYFYWDDFILTGRAAEHPLLSADLLFYDHDGHVMPLAFAVAWIMTTAAPLQWGAAAASLLVLQLAASVAVLRMLVVLLGWRPLLLVPFVFYLFSPLSLPAFAWWAAGLNALPLQAALAWVTADAVKLVQTGRWRYAASGLAALVIALLFFEKSVVIPVVVFGLAVLWARVTDGTGQRGLGGAAREVAYRGRALWIGSVVLVLWWLPLYFSVVRRDFRAEEGSSAATILGRTFTDSLVPALFGGPWRWERWLPSTPWAAAPQWATIAAWCALIITVAAVLITKRHAGGVIGFATAYVVLATVPVLAVRVGPEVAPELVQSLRYLAETSVIITAAIALICLAPARSSERRFSRRVVTMSGAAAGAAFVASSMWSTGAFTHSWSESPARDYLSNIRSGTVPGTAAEVPVKLLDQEVPWQVLGPLTYPNNLASRVLAPLRDQVHVTDAVPELLMLTDDGHIVPAEVWWNRGIPQGPEPDCGWFLTAGEPVVVPLGGDMVDHGWTVQLNYFASADGEVGVAFDSAAGRRAPVTVPVEEGINTAFVRLIGGADALHFEVFTPETSICLGSGPVGVASHAGD